MAGELYPAERLERARQALAGAGVDALLLTPGADLRYLTGYDAHKLERLTCLVLPRAGDPVLVVPGLEQPAAAAAPAPARGLSVVGWPETADPFDLVVSLLRERLDGPPHRVGLADDMWAQHVLGFRRALPTTEQALAGEVLSALRTVKSPEEVAALRRAGAAIDRVHQLLPGWRWVGRTEREMGRDIADAILAEGHATVNFVIVGSGPNAASPHHTAGDRRIQPGDEVVVDIGGTTADGYCSDETRTYVVGEPGAEMAEQYGVLKAAQAAACAAVRPGVPAAAVDAAAREIIAAAGLGALFIHRTGHGIGLDAHEAPWIVEGNDEPLRPGMCFSVEPGVYQPGRHGARIEDIVAVTDDGVELLNHVERDLIPVAG